MTIGIAISRLGRMRGTERFRVTDMPGGRMLTKEPKPEKIADVEDDGRRYDVVAIGGYSWMVTGVAEPGTAVGFETVDGAFGEKNHIFHRFLTARQVQNVRITWGRGKTADIGSANAAGTFLAIAAIPHGTRGQIPHYTPEWFNEAIPSDMVAARTCFGVKVDNGHRYENRELGKWVDVGEYDLKPLTVTLTLKIGVIGPAVRDPW